ncbi:MAG: glycosyltransferase family 2 protein [Deltaproteobacteria bacterium]|nr:glycosyltransferase family 2 protein [Deltaproteobacteria bacterium]
MKTPERTAVVICAHQRVISLERCMNGFLAIAGDPQDLILVDNGSRDELSGWIARQYPGVTVVRLAENRLFCGGYNAGIRVAIDRGYDFVLISNADTEVVNSGFLQELIKAARRWPRGAFFGPQVFLRSFDVIQKTCLQFPKVFRNAWLWLPWRVARRYFEEQVQEEAAVEFLNGVCVLCRVKAVKEIGLMDENMGGYVEDADWAWRAQKKGWSSVFIPVPSIVHHENSNGYEPYSLKTFLLKRNTVYWYLKIGRRASALSYARASQFIAMVRFYLANNGEEKNMHRYFLEKLATCFSGLLSNQALGEWFGPPLGPWREEEAS